MFLGGIVHYYSFRLKVKWGYNPLIIDIEFFIKMPFSTTLFYTLRACMFLLILYPAAIANSKDQTRSYSLLGILLAIFKNDCLFTKLIQFSQFFTILGMEMYGCKRKIHSWLANNLKAIILTVKLCFIKYICGECVIVPLFYPLQLNSSNICIWGKHMLRKLSW